jgi:uncharacterized protein (DUF2342 family)
MRTALAARRRRSGLERTFQKAIGFEQKILQYDAGERFVREVIDGAGMEAFNSVWRSAEHLPSMEEIAAPARWIERVSE